MCMQTHQGQSLGVVPLASPTSLRQALLSLEYHQWSRIQATDLGIGLFPISQQQVQAHAAHVASHTPHAWPLHMCSGELTSDHHVCDMNAQLLAWPLSSYLQRKQRLKHFGKFTLFYSLKYR